MIRRVLITGSAGVVGSALATELRAEGYDVVASTSREGDLRDPKVAERIVSEAAADAVVHLAARVHGLMGNITAQGRAYLDNVRINTNVVEAARISGVKKFVGMGSTAVYSDVVPLPMRESSIWDGPPHDSESGYAHAKRAMIAQLIAYKDEFGLDYAVTLSTNLYGPADRFDEDYGHVLPSLVSKFHRAISTGTDVTVWGTGTPTRDFLYAADAARALRMVMESASGVINLATGTSVTIKEAVETLAEVTGYSGQVIWDSSRPDGQHARTYDVQKIRELGWEPKVSLAEGLDVTYRWYAANRAAVRRCPPPPQPEPRTTTSMTITSYAQNFEDVLLWRALSHVASGHYLDVGAGHPVRHSVTKLFYDAGWSGVNVEPLPAMAAQLRRRRPRDTTVEAAVCESSEATVELVVVELWDELSSIRPDRIERLQQEGRLVNRITVATTRLDTLVEELGWSDLHFLKVDVEGAELEVVRTLDLHRTRPWIVVAEVVSGDGESNSRSDLRSHLESSDYVFAYFDGLNDFYVAAERASELLPAFMVPVNVTDDFVVASDTDRVVVELVGQRLGLDSPVQADELIQRVDGLLRDRIDFENKLTLAGATASDEADAVRREVEAPFRARIAELDDEVGELRLTNESFRQTSFERERLVAWYAAQLANHRGLADRHAAEAAATHTRVDELAAQAAETQRRLTDVLSSTSWRVTLPFRVIRRPRTYVRKLLSK